MNYLRFSALEHDLMQAKLAFEAKQDRIAKSAALGKFRNQFLSLQSRSLGRMDYAETLGSELEALMDAVHDFVCQHFDEGQASLLRPAERGPLDLTAQRMEENLQGEFVWIYMGAQYQANAIGKLIEKVSS